MSVRTSSTPPPFIRTPPLHSPLTLLPLPCSVESVDGQSLRYLSSEGKSILQSFNSIFGPSCSQEHVMDVVGLPLVNDCLRGISGALLCYGQTGAGKTHTITGAAAGAERGLIPRILDHLFTVGSSAPYSQLDVRCSYTEVFSERVRDLLNPHPSEYEKWSADYASAHPMTAIANAKEAGRLFTEGQSRRQVARTAMNDQSSRSHTLLTLRLSCVKDGRRVDASITLVDLAGSERMQGNVDEQQREGVAINSSLSALNRVFMALINSSSHIPFNDCTLTKLLRPFLDPRRSTARTVLIFHVSPEPCNGHDTRGTLKFAERCKKIRGPAVVERAVAASEAEAQQEYVMRGHDWPAKVMDEQEKRRVVEGMRKAADGWRKAEGGGQTKRRKLDVQGVEAEAEAQGELEEELEDYKQTVRLLLAMLKLSQADLADALQREVEKGALSMQLEEQRQARRRAEAEEAARLMAQMLPHAQPLLPRSTRGKENTDVTQLTSPLKLVPSVTPAPSPAPILSPPLSSLQSPRANGLPLSSIASIIEAKVSSSSSPSSSFPSLVDPLPAVAPLSYVGKQAVLDYVGGGGGGWRYPSGELEEELVKGLVGGGGGGMRSPMRSSLMR